MICFHYELFSAQNQGIKPEQGHANMSSNSSPNARAQRWNTTLGDWPKRSGLWTLCQGRHPLSCQYVDVPVSMSQAQVISCLENECENKVASTAILLHQGRTAFVCIGRKQKNLADHSNEKYKFLTTYRFSTDRRNTTIKPAILKPCLWKPFLHCIIGPNIKVFLILRFKFRWRRCIAEESVQNNYKYVLNISLSMHSMANSWAKPVTPMQSRLNKLPIMTQAKHQHIYTRLVQNTIPQNF